ncbi:MAG: alcohol dehydrogenase catalytic domain-containing protein, partial [Solirubrobacterales bacterium]
MQAVTISDGELLLAEHPDPEPGAGEVLVAVRGAGLNGADLLQLKGGYPAPPGSPADIPGLELAGEVVALGPGAGRFAAGDRVLGIVGGGGQAELCAVHEHLAGPGLGVGVVGEEQLAVADRHGLHRRESKPIR